MLDKFCNAEPDLCYMDGNSLGRLPVAAATRLNTLVNQGWGQDLIRGWNADWIHLPKQIGGKISQLVGAKADEVIVADSTSVNLFKLATASLRLQTGRRTVLTDATNFPSDLYILESACQAAGGIHQIHTLGSRDDIEFPLTALLQAIDSDTALVCLSHVAFRSGAIADMQAVSEAARKHGALVLWDLSHSVGALPIDLQACGVDMAVGCTYKYLCGGPGAPAFIYVSETLCPELPNPIQGWFSHARPFEFAGEYSAADGIDKFLTGTPPILSLAAIEAGVELVSQAGLHNLRERSLHLTTQLVEQVDARLGEYGFELRSPRDASQRGSHVSLGHSEARRINANLIQRHKVIPDFRTPDNIRFGIAPLYTTERDVTRAIDALEQTMRLQEFLTVASDDSPVT